MIRARCGSCGERYPAWDEHTCAASKERPLPARESVNDKPSAALVANTPAVVANKKRSGDRHKDADARCVYQRDLMRKRRAENTAAALKTVATQAISMS